MIQQVRRVLVNAIRPRLHEFRLAIAAAAQADAEGLGSAGTQEIPNTVSDDDAVAQGNAELAARQSEIRPDQAWPVRHGRQ